MIESGARGSAEREINACFIPDQAKLDCYGRSATLLTILPAHDYFGALLRNRPWNLSEISETPFFNPFLIPRFSLRKSSLLELELDGGLGAARPTAGTPVVVAVMPSSEAEWTTGSGTEVLA